METDTSISADKSMNKGDLSGKNKTASEEAAKKSRQWSDSSTERVREDKEVDDYTSSYDKTSEQGKEFRTPDDRL